MEFDKRLKLTSWIIFFTLIAFAIIFRYWNHSWHNIISSDGKGYYAYLPAIFIFNDLNFEYFFNGLLDIDPEYTSSFLYNIENNLVIKYPAGVAFLLTPFFFLAVIITFLTGGVVDGYSFWFQILTSIGAITFTTLGAWWLGMTLKKLNLNIQSSILIIVALVFGTNLTNYTIWDASMSHAYSFSMVALLLYQFRLYIELNHGKHLIWTAFALAVIILIRPVNAVVILALPLIADNWEQFIKSIKSIFNKPKVLVIAILVFGMVIFIQPLLWYLQNGSWYVWTYLDEGFNFSNPEVIKVLFSYRKGWILYTPLMVFTFISFIILIFKQNYFKLFFSFLFFSLTTYIISSWWCWYYGGSFGQRAFIEFYPVAGILFTSLFSINSKLLHKIISGCFGLLIIINLIQSFQYKNNIIHYDSMDKDGYWKTFLRTDNSFKFSLYGNERDIADQDIAATLTSRYFMDFEYNKSFWKFQKSYDLSDEALSGNKVISFLNIPDTVIFEMKLDSLFKSEKDNYIRFSAYFKGDAELLIKEDILLTLAEPEFKLKLIPEKSGINIREWEKYEVSVKVPYSNNLNQQMTIKFPNKLNSKIYMDDAMISIYYKNK